MIGWTNNTTTRQDIEDEFMENRGLIIDLARKYRMPDDAEAVNGYYAYLFDDEHERYRKYDPERSESPLNFIAWYARQYFHSCARSQARRTNRMQTIATRYNNEGRFGGIDPTGSIETNDTIRVFRKRLTDTQRDAFDALVESHGDRTEAAAALGVSKDVLSRRVCECARVARTYRLIA